MDSKKVYVKEIIYKATLFSALAMSVAACSGFGLFGCLINFCAAAVFTKADDKKTLLYTLTGFAVSLYSVSTIGAGLSVIAFCAAGLLYFAFSRISALKNAVSNPAAEMFFIFASAITITVLTTNQYFGIGANGTTVIEMLKSYRSFGFHPNWRGILYGTIVMVVMITYPRKFKNASQYVNSAFLGLAVTFILNIFLIPKSTVSPVAFTGAPKINFDFLNDISFSQINAGGIFNMIIAAAALALIILSANSKNESVKEAAAGSLLTVAIPFAAGYSMPGRFEFKKKSLICGLISAVLIAGIMLCGGFWPRMPVSSCAVVLIVAGWQNLHTGRFKTVFKNPAAVIAFLIPLIIAFFTNMPAGIIAAALLSLILGKKLPAEESPTHTTE